MKVLLGNLDVLQFEEPRKAVTENPLRVAQSLAQARDEALLAEERARLAHARLAEEHARLVQQNAALQFGRSPPGLAQQRWVPPAFWQQANAWTLPQQHGAPPAKDASTTPLASTAGRCPPGLTQQQVGRVSGCGFLVAERPSIGSQASTNVGARSREPSPSVSLSSRGSHESAPVAAPTHTTLILRNLPMGYSRDDLLELLDDEGFNGKYDLVYHPIDFGTRLGFGYAFVNFVSADAATECSEYFNGFASWKTNQDKACEVSQSTELQGLEAHVERYRNSPVMHESVPDEFKPAAFADGHRVPFPLPTKKVTKPRAPRVRRQEMRVAKRVAME